MAAYEIPNLRFSGASGGSITRRRFVTVNASEQIIQVATQGQQPVGVSSQPTTAVNQVAEVYDGIVIVEAGTAITPGTVVMSDNQGRAIAYVSGAGVYAAGVAVTAAGAAGELLSVKTLC